MDFSHIIAQLDAEISRISQARDLLSGTDIVHAETKAARATPKTRNLTPEGRKKIADAVRRRWAKQRAK